MKLFLTPASMLDDCVGLLRRWQQCYVLALPGAELEALPALAETMKRGRLRHNATRQVQIIRAELTRVLLSFFRCGHLRHFEPCTLSSGKDELRTLQLQPDTPLARKPIQQLVIQAAQLNEVAGCPYDDARRRLEPA
jgi:hypothetical protein